MQKLVVRLTLLTTTTALLCQPMLLMVSQESLPIWNLRSHSLRLLSAKAFIDLDSELVGTMLHELTHNVHGPHDQAFYKVGAGGAVGPSTNLLWLTKLVPRTSKTKQYLDGLNDEYDHLRASGYTGEGFLSAGQKLSTATHDARLPLHLARQRALAEAERRQKLQQVMGPPGGQRLGGGGGARQASATASQKTPKQRILEAAERRQRDEKRCGGHEGNDGEGRAEREAAKAAQQAVTIDLTEEEEEAALPQTQPPQPSSSRTTLSDPHSARPQPTNDEADGDDDEVELVAISTPLKKRKRSSSGSTGSAGMGWSCPACTFVNKAECLQCDVCECPREDRQRPPDPQEGFARKAEQPPAAATTGHWVCHTCGRVEEHKWWSCKQCGTIKLSS